MTKDCKYLTLIQDLPETFFLIVQIVEILPDNIALLNKLLQ